MTELDVIQKIAERLTTLDMPVFSFQDHFSGADTPPYLGVIFESRAAQDGGTRLIGSDRLNIAADLLIIGTVVLDADNGPEAPLQLLTDIDRALLSAEADLFFQPLGMSLSPTTAAVLPHEDGDAHTEIQSRFTVQFTKTLT